MLFKNLFDEQIENIRKILSPSKKKESYLVRTKWEYEFDNDVETTFEEWKKREE